MPFQSEKQRRFMWAKHPKIAEKWAHETGSKSQPKKRGAAFKDGYGSQKRAK